MVTITPELFKAAGIPCRVATRDVDSWKNTIPCGIDYKHCNIVYNITYRNDQQKDQLKSYLPAYRWMSDRNFRLSIGKPPWANLLAGLNIG